MSEQTARLQELRRQLSSGGGARVDSESDLALELQAMQEELRMALRREKENQEVSRSQLDSLARTLHLKEELIRVSRREVEDRLLAVARYSSVCVCAGPPEADGGALSSPTGGASHPGDPGAKGEPGTAGRAPSQGPRPGPGPSQQPAA